MDHLRKTTTTAVALTFGMMCILIVFVMNVAGQSDFEAGQLVSLAAVLVLTYCAIFQWIRCAREYIDLAIDRKLASDVKS
jgi:hypothetical protein